jgi:hypothetical protein
MQSCAMAAPKSNSRSLNRPGIVFVIMAFLSASADRAPSIKATDSDPILSESYLSKNKVAWLRVKALHTASHTRQTNSAATTIAHSAKT